MEVSLGRQRAPRAPRALRASLRSRVVGWRARNWRRALLAYFALSLAMMAIAAEPAADFPRAQIGTTALSVLGVIVAAVVPVVLAVLP
jgi:hypothetical protein